MSESCIFCNWVNGKQKAAQTVYEDESILVVLCDSPVAKGHTLVILKTHKCDLASVEIKDAAHLGEVVARNFERHKTGIEARKCIRCSCG